MSHHILGALVFEDIRLSMTLETPLLILPKYVHHQSTRYTTFSAVIYQMRGGYPTKLMSSILKFPATSLPVQVTVMVSTLLPALFQRIHGTAEAS